MIPTPKTRAAILQWAQQAIHDTETADYLAQAVACYERASDPQWRGVAASLAGSLQGIDAILANKQLSDDEARRRAQRAALAAIGTYAEAGGR